MDLFVDALLSKILTKSEIIQKCEEHTKNAQTIVFTNGCFDIIHKGHVLYLAKAKQKGDILVVGLNSDASISRIKGPNRPIKEQESRILTLAAFSCVDYIVVFDEDTPLQLIEAIKPNVLVKGKDYNVDSIVGADIVLSLGGKVETIDLEAGFSSTNYINKLLK